MALHEVSFDGNICDGAPGGVLKLSDSSSALLNSTAAFSGTTGFDVYLEFDNSRLYTNLHDNAELMVNPEGKAKPKPITAIPKMADFPTADDPAFARLQRVRA